MHHNYIGGLLEHTYECLDFAKIILTNPRVKEKKSQEEFFKPNDNIIKTQYAEICGMAINSNETYFASGCNDGNVKVVYGDGHTTRENVKNY